MCVKLFDEKALQKVFKNSSVLVFNNRTKIITDGIFVVKNYSTVEFKKDILSALFPKAKNIREHKNFNTILCKPKLCYEKTCIIIEYNEKKYRIYKRPDSDNIIVIDDKYTQYFPLYLYAYKDFKINKGFKIICYNKETRENSNFIVMGVKYYDTLTEAMENNFLVS